MSKEKLHSIAPDLRKRPDIEAKKFMHGIKDKIVVITGVRAD